MPVLLTRDEEFDTWLRGSTDEALSLVRQNLPEPRLSDGACLCPEREGEAIGRWFSTLGNSQFFNRFLLRRPQTSIYVGVSDVVV